MTLKQAGVAFVVLSAATILAAAPGAPAKSHIAAAEELVQAIGPDNATEAGLEMFRAILQQNPDLEPYESVFKSWFLKIFESEAFKTASRDVYIKHFTEAELRQISQFYKTEVGQKLARSLPVIVKESAEASARFIQENLPELEARLAEARNETAKEKEP